MSGSNVETWRVVLADGSVRRVEVRAFEYQGRHICWTANRHATGGSKGAAVVRWARNLSLDAREILAPGDPTRAELLAQLAAAREELSVSDALAVGHIDRLRAETEPTR
jgi:hypothetical protein